MRKILFILSAAIVLQVGTAQSLSATTILVSKTNIIPNKNDPDPAKVKAAVEQFKTLSHHEKKMKLKEVNKQVREYKKQKRDKDDNGVSTLLLVIIAILLPPLAVALHEGGINSRFWIDLLLTLLFYLPGLIYALVIILGNNQ
ncbi:MAG: YqaE/Pmp3 family membrane protein [Chitinophagales bacterium]